MPKSDSGPSEDPPGAVPAGRTDGVGLCCACPASGRANTIGDDKYFSCTYNPGWSIRNKSAVSIARTNTGGTVTLSKSFSLAYINGATAATHGPVLNTAITSAMSAWTSAARRYRVQITQPSCSVQKLRMVFASSIVASGADVAVTADNQPSPAPNPDGTFEDLRSYVSGGTSMTFYIQGVGNVNWTMIHEIGHTFGLPDEYTYDRTAATPAPTCTYTGADNPDKMITLSTSSIPADAGKFGFDNASIMGRNGNNTYTDNLFYWISIEVKKILKNEGINADVQIVAK